MADREFFTSDLEAPLYALTLRSPIARGRLVSVECPKLSVNYALLLARDIPGKNRLAGLPAPVLAEESLSYYGEPLGLLIGPEAARLEEIAARCYIKTESEAPPQDRGALADLIIADRRRAQTGDPEQAFREAKKIMEFVYTTGIQDYWYSEPLGAVADWEDGRIRIHTATQWPFHVKRSAAAVLALDADAVSVEPARIGIHLEGKLWYPSLVACQAALGALYMKRRVKLMFSRIEDFRYGPKRNAAEIRVRSALGEGGELLAVAIRALADLGSYGVFSNEVLDRTCLGALGPYKPAALDLEGIACLTNIPPAGPIAGFGMAQGFFAAERQASIIADALRLDPLEWRKHHFFNRKKPSALGISLGDAAPLDGILDTAASMGDYRRKWASYELQRRSRGTGNAEAFASLRGIGIALAYQGSGFLYTRQDEGPYSVSLTLDKEGRLDIRTSVIASHEEYTAIWREIAAETLSIEARSVRVIHGTTDQAPDSGPSGLSWNCAALTALVEQACADIRNQRFRGPLPITVSRYYEPAVKRPGEEGAERRIDANCFARPGWAAAVVEAAIDPVEYRPKVRGIWLAVDGGKILSEARARRSLQAAAVQALGWASQECPVYESGRLSERRSFHYALCDLRDIPPISIDFLWNETPVPRGIGELPFGCVPAAYVQAVSQAVDHPFTHIPLTARDIWEARRVKDGKEEQ
ncbi:MAG: xanthine dehydrogenase family protein molybdopterin-binding subunit [Treponema sp.]|jgi:CO/xanthine dehydrogenase Mo-binding subunit|nr:xanthine dehydrogenase family protein molybdopterin-binding subunit [Treponema sp.]